MALELSGEHPYAVRVLRGWLQMRHQRLQLAMRDWQGPWPSLYDMEHPCPLSLQEGETCLARFPTTDGHYYHFTTHRMLRQTGQGIGTVVPYGCILDVIWPADPLEKRTCKMDSFHSLDIITADTRVVLDGFCNCSTAVDMLILIAEHNRTEQEGRPDAEPRIAGVCRRASGAPRD